MASTSVAATHDEFRGQLESRTRQFAEALPSHIRPEHFQRAAITAINQNPKLLNVDRRSLFNALMRCAQDGLIPDGRQAVLVIYKDRERGEVAQYQQMVAGIRLLVQQSGEISRFEQTVVYENDQFEYCLGDNPHIDHRPAIDNRGPPILVYSVAQYGDGTLSREVMTVDEIEKVRGVSRSKNGQAWTEWWGEMARKTVAKRHAKVLPTSNDAKVALARDDAEHFSISPPSQAVVDIAAASRRPRLAEKLDALSETGAEEQSPTARRRGRPARGKEAASPPADDADLPPPDQPPADVQLDLEGAQGHADPAMPDDGWPGERPDFEQGVKDAKAGRAGCLNRDIRDDPARLAEWQKGFNSKTARS